MKNIFIITVLLLVASTAMIPAAAAENGVLSDPMTIGVGARSLGMGKAYVAVAEDGDAIFMNPAGLARSSNPKLSSMYTNLMGDVGYMVIGGVYPCGEKSAIGAGFIGSRVDGVILTDSTGAIQGTNGNWGNNVMFLSYGTYLNEIPILNPNLGRDVLVGGSLKYFSVGGSGNSSIEAASGSTFDADLGILYPVNDLLVVGASVQNILGSKVSKSTGSGDVLSSNLKVGVKATLMGEKGAPLSSGSSNRKLYALVDYDSPLRGAQESATHFGLEFWPSNNLALRVGVDNKEPTAGVGVRIAGLEFNYAYHPYNGIAEDSTHFFSIGYLGENRQRELRVNLATPQDKSVIYEDHAKVSGTIEVIEGDTPPPSGPISLKINGQSITVNPDNTFSADIPVSEYGKKLLVFEVSDSAGTYRKDEIRLVRLTSFADVPDGYWAKNPIENNATVALVEGYPDGTFRPERALTRAELATLLVRAKGIKINEGRAQQMFKDVKADHWAAKYIEVAQKEGLVKGYPDKTFRPNNKINKVEGIVVMTRFDNLKLAEVEAKPYWDISTEHWAARYIAAAKENGMLKFIERNRLRPKEALVRSEAVEMLGKTQMAGAKIRDLYNWEKGFNYETTPERPQIRASLY